MSMAYGAEEGRGKRRNATARRKQSTTRGYPNGETRPRGNARSSVNESIVHEKTTRGIETSQYPEEKKIRMIP